jgi:hypothetical protein
MTALALLQDVVDETTATVSGAGRVVTAPLASNRQTLPELNRFVKREVGTILDGVLIVPSTAVLYTLLTERTEESIPWRLGKGAGWGIGLFIASGILRRVVL